jgi:very-short-patch-repair endonuclease
MSRNWKCDCGWTNYFRPLPEWPEVPRSLYIGSDKNRLLKLYPVPPEEAGQAWAQPYAVRSFVHQASRGLGGCYYTCRERGKVFDELVFSDVCSDADDQDINAPAWNCHVLAGWSAGQATCRLWEHAKALCQNDTERNFMLTYLRYVKDRQFPMLIPQVRIGIAERRRPDFVVFVPLQYWRSKWIAIELDHAHGEEHQQNDNARDLYLEEQNYEVVSLHPNAKGYLEEVKSLVEKIEIWMNLADTDAWEVAVQVDVTRTEESDDIPF